MDLKPLSAKLNTYSNRILSFDTETIGKSNDFYMGSIYDGNQHIVFYDKEKMKKYLLSSQFRNFKIFATNLQFDLASLYYPYSPKWKLFFIGSQLIFAKYQPKEKKSAHNMIFVDTLNLAFASVEKLGKMLNLPKLEKPFFLGYKPLNDNEENILLEYNKRDTEITYKFAIYFNNTLNSLGSELRNTIAGCSLDLYRRKYMKQNFKCPNRNILDKFYEGYFGGRTEVFQYGTVKNKKYYDVNSLYPFVMQNEYPDINFIRYTKNPNKSLLEYDGITNVDIYCPDMYIPYLPVRFNNRVIFPTGNIKGTFTNFEIRKALTLGYELKSLNWSIYYLKNFSPFKEYVQDLYRLRLQYSKEENEIMKYTIKILMNSLYGKFGIHPGKNTTGFFQIIDNSDEIINIPENLTLVQKDDGFAYVTIPLKTIPLYCNPILSIYTTAYARTHLYDSILKVKDITYCDTDSLVTSKELPTGTGLGEWKLEFTVKEGTYIFPKFYRQIGINQKGKEEILIRVKGVPLKNAKKFFNTHYTKYRKILKTKEAYNRMMKVNTKVWMHKELKNTFHKRTLINGDIDILSEYTDTIPISI